MCWDKIGRMTYDIEQINREQSHSEVDPFTEGRYRQFARHLGSDFTGLALDVGCNIGRGGRAFLAAASNAQLDGVELLTDRIERIPAGIYREVYPGLLKDVPGEAGAYDVLLMGELIEHVPFATLDDLIEQSRRLLARGGRLLLTTPNPHYVLLRRQAGGNVLGGAHVSVHCPVALRQYLAWKGWEVETVTGSGRVSARLGEKLPLALYGSYLVVARKPVT
jgi:SAM-dependent methyltransferase